NCKEKASFFLIVFFNLLILCQKLLIQRYTYRGSDAYVVVKDALLANKFKLVFYLGSGLLGRGIGQCSNFFPLAINRL
ncbi:hypothetical protein, partial [Piscirickettsia salmonis]|uniref:hypothetical protein n=2 Tax=Piscirickettsia salmonis TaxID=1238 RepID=UPI0009B91299